MARDDRTAELRAALEEKNARITELETEVRELRRLAMSFVEDATEHLDGSPREPERSAAGQPGTGRGGTHRGATDRDVESAVEAADDGDAGDAFAAFGELMNGDSGTADSDGESPSTDDGLAALAGVGDDSERGTTHRATGGGRDRRARSDGGLDVRSVSTEVAEFEGGAAAVGDADLAAGDGRPAIVASLEAALDDLDTVSLRLLSLYRAEGPEMPADAYHAVTGTQDRRAAYVRNRELRRAGLVEHVGRGHYDYSLRARMEVDMPVDRDDDMAAVYARDLEQAFLD